MEGQRDEDAAEDDKGDAARDAGVGEDLAEAHTGPELVQRLRVELVGVQASGARARLPRPRAMSRASRRSQPESPPGVASSVGHVDLFTTGDMTTVLGTLNVDQALAFDTTLGNVASSNSDAAPAIQCK